MEKELYENLEMEIIVFIADDILTESKWETPEVN